MLELLLIADSAKDERKIVYSELSTVQSRAERVQQVQHIAFCLRNEFLGTGILKAEDHRCKTRQFFVKYFRREILRTGHVHGRAETILQQLFVGVLIEFFGLHDKPEVRIISMMSHFISELSLWVTLWPQDSSNQSFSLPEKLAWLYSWHLARYCPNCVLRLLNHRF